MDEEFDGVITPELRKEIDDVCHDLVALFDGDTRSETAIIAALVRCTGQRVGYAVSRFERGDSAECEKGIEFFVKGFRHAAKIGMAVQELESSKCH